MQTTRDSLENLKKIWKTPNDAENLPDGIYSAIIKRAGAYPSDRCGDVFKWTLQIVNGKHNGYIVRKFSDMRSDYVRYLESDLIRLGVEDIRDNDTITNQLNNMKVEINLVTKGNFQNCYINKIIKDEPNHNAAPFMKDPVR